MEELNVYVYSLIPAGSVAALSWLIQGTLGTRQEFAHTFTRGACFWKWRTQRKLIWTHGEHMKLDTDSNASSGSMWSGNAACCTTVPPRATSVSLQSWHTCSWLRSWWISWHSLTMRCSWVWFTNRLACTSSVHTSCEKLKRVNDLHSVIWQRRTAYTWDRTNHYFRDLINLPRVSNSEHGINMCLKSSGTHVHLDGINLLPNENDLDMEVC